MTTNQLLALKPGQKIRIRPKADKIAPVKSINKGARYIGDFETGYFKHVPYVDTVEDGGWFADQVELVE